MATVGDNAWTARYKDLTEASQAITAKETDARDAKTARLRAARLAAGAADPDTPTPDTRRNSPKRRPAA